MDVIPLIVGGMLAALLATPEAFRDDPEASVTYRRVACWAGLLAGGIAFLLTLGRG